MIFVRAAKMLVHVVGQKFSKFVLAGFSGSWSGPELVFEGLESPLGPNLNSAKIAWKTGKTLHLQP